MNFVTLQLASGTAFFEGIAVVLIALVALFLFKGRIIRSACTILVLVGIFVVVGSGTPLASWLYGIWCIFAIACLVSLEKSHPSERVSKWGKSTVILFVLFSCGLCVSEARYRVIPTIKIPPRQRIYVIGDSISAGLGPKEKTWPAVLSQSAGLDVVNLAQAGATVSSALQQTSKVAVPHSMVILEIGGNDLLGDTTAAEFREQLEAILVKLREGDHPMVMFELPLLPFKNGFGQAQRSLAAKYHVVLIPKKILTTAFGLPGGTTDGLHLSQKGHDALARMVSDIFLSQLQ